MIGIHHSIAASQYHADAFGPVPTLSSSIAKIILGRTPRHAWTAHSRLNPEPAEDDDGKFDLGSAAHEIILSRGGGIDVHDFADWRTKDAKAARVASREAGRTPMLTTQYERALKIAEAAWAHPHAVFDLDVGHPETVLVWRDIGGPLCRAMLDWWDGETVITDVKTTDVPLTDASLARQISSLSYDLSAAFYIRGLVALRADLAGRLKFRWLFVETTAPFGTRMIEADPFLLTIGDRKAAMAIARWKRRLDAGVDQMHWPAWSSDIGRVDMPPWYEADQMKVELLDEETASAAIFADAMPAYAPRKLTEPV